MKGFFGSFIGTLVGVLVATMLIFIVLLGIIFSSMSTLSSGKEKLTSVKSNSILHLTFDREIVDRATNNPFDHLNFKNPSSSPTGLNSIVENIEKAKNDKNIVGIYLDLSSISTGIATLEEIRNSLIDFKKSKKFIVSYSENYTQGAYYLATVSDKLYLNPQGMVDFKGLSQQVMFFKNLLDKMDVNMQIFRHGKFKSATEPYFLDKMSEANRHQVMSYIGSIWNNIESGISQQRNIPIAELNRYADNMMITNSASALNYKLVDKLVYKDEMLNILAELTGEKNVEDISFVPLNKYTSARNAIHKPYSKDKIAVVYATGNIESGEGDDKSIGSERISKAIREARMDKEVKAIVLRVNSPGGSSLASDIIWREMVLAKKEKPVVVSMGDVAASGGYYIACAADAIVAHPNTITGSIGVFGVFPNVEKLFSEKLGINVDTVKTNKHSDFGNLFRAVSPDEGAVVQKWIEDVYQDFIGKVAEGRHTSAASIDSIGQGRVWSGVDGKKIGLVDEFGGLKDAIRIASEKAKIKNYTLLELPKQKDSFEEIVNNFIDNESMMDKKLQSEFGSTYENYKRLQSILKYKGIQMRMPYDILIY